MNKPKIAILCPKFGIVERGSEIYIAEIANRLSRDFDITIYARTKSAAESSNPPLHSPSLQVNRFFALTEQNHLVNRLYHSHPALTKLLDKFFLNPSGIESLSFCLFALPSLLFGRFSLILPDNGIWGSIYCRLIRFINKTPFIAKSSGGIEPIVGRQMPNLFICETPVVFDWFQKNLPQLKLCLIPPAVDMGKYSLKVSPVKLALPRPIFLCVGAFIPAKRIDLAIKAVAKLKRGSLVILGSGPLKSALIELANKLLTQDRFLITEVANNQIAHYYRAADVFTLPSFDEPFGKVYLEAMASGLPVVATNDQQRRYIIGQAGILCDVENINKYAKALLTASQTNFGAKPRLQARRFAWKIISKQYLSCFQNVLNPVKID